MIDDQGVNRTPKPLVAIVTSAALRQARYLGMQESVLGSETSEALLGEVSSTAFGRGWFDSASVTPQESSNDLDYSRECAGVAGNNWQAHTGLHAGLVGTWRSAALAKMG